MQLVDIITAFETARRAPKAELAAAVTQAAALAPSVIAGMRRAASGTVLLPREEKLVFYGVYALAAARHTAAFPAWIALLHGNEAMLDRLFGDALTGDGPGLTIGLFDGNADLLLAALADPTLEGHTRWALFQALAWLAWKERVPRAAAASFLARFHAEALAPPGDAAWRGWEEAVTLLGVGDLASAAIERAGEDDTLRQVDIDDIRTRLAEAVDRPDDATRFTDAGIVPIDDPAATLAWLRPSPPVIRGALDPDDLRWLTAFLHSDEAPSRAMSAEELDGFITALAVLPTPILPQTYIPAFWGEADGDTPPIEDAEKRALIEDILTRYPGHIAARLAATEPFLARLDGPSMDDGDDTPYGMEWAAGFQRGIAFDRAAWDRLTTHPVHGPATDAIARVAEGRPDPHAAQWPPVRASKTARLLGDAARTGYRFLRNLPIAAPVGALRTPKIGRNDPCPCGSGKKYKKCCGAAA